MPGAHVQAVGVAGGTEHRVEGVRSSRELRDVRFAYPDGARLVQPRDDQLVVFWHKVAVQR
jgi:hypothetical protein